MNPPFFIAKGTFHGWAGLNWLIRENEAFDRWQRRKCDVRRRLSVLSADAMGMGIAKKDDSTSKKAEI